VHVPACTASGFRGEAVRGAPNFPYHRAIRVRRVSYTEECERLSINDLVRELRARVRRDFGPRPKAEVSTVIADRLVCPPGIALDGYDTGFGHRQMLRCGCGRRMFVAFRPLGFEGFACRACAHVRYVSQDRGRIGCFAGLGNRLLRVESYLRRPGRRPRWVQRELGALWPLVRAARDALSDQSDGAVGRAVAATRRR
jgi:hypothetical protein